MIKMFKRAHLKHSWLSWIETPTLLVVYHDHIAFTIYIVCWWTGPDNPIDSGVHQDFQVIRCLWGPPGYSVLQAQWVKSTLYQWVLLYNTPFHLRTPYLRCLLGTQSVWCPPGKLCIVSLRASNLRLIRYHRGPVNIGSSMPREYKVIQAQ